MAKKRKAGQGSVHLRKDGRWEGRYVIGYDEFGLPKTKNVLAYTKTDCQQKLKKLTLHSKKSLKKKWQNSKNAWTTNSLHSCLLLKNNLILSIDGGESIDLTHLRCFSFYVYI